MYFSLFFASNIFFFYVPRSEGKNIILLIFEKLFFPGQTSFLNLFVNQQPNQERRIIGKSDETSSKRRFQCPNCEKSYTLQHNLAKHMRLECGGRKNFFCHLCEWAFSQKMHLQRHLHSIHKI